MSIPTQITIRPAYTEDPVFGVRTPGDTDHAARSDVTHAANPLHYVPFVSQVYEAATGETGSSAMKIAASTVLGGPLGLVVGIANAIFEEITGDTIGTAVASVFSGEPAPVQVASVTPAAAPVAPVAQEILPPAKTAALSSAQATEMAQETQMKMASAMADVGVSREDSAVLSLFGGQSPSAHRSYQKAQMLPYLQDVNSSLVM